MDLSGGFIGRRLSLRKELFRPRSAQGFRFIPLETGTIHEESIKIHVPTYLLWYLQYRCSFPLVALSLGTHLRAGTS